MRLSKKAKENLKFNQQDAIKLTDKQREENRKKRNRLKSMRFDIQTVNEKPVNRKKNRGERRQRGKLGVYIPYVLLNLGEFQSKHKAQQAINNGLFRRAQVARRKGGYLVFEKLNRGEK